MLAAKVHAPLNVGLLKLDAILDSLLQDLNDLCVRCSLEGRVRNMLQSLDCLRIYPADSTGKHQDMQVAAANCV